MGSNMARGAIGAGAVGGAVAGTAVLGAANSAGQIGALVGRAVQAGEEGWDEDGNFVCSKFVFNFRTMQVFDGSETHAISDIREYSYQDHVFKLFFKEKIKPKVILVGTQDRSEMIGKILSDTWNGVTFTPDKNKLLPAFLPRMRRVKVGTVARYTIRSVFLGAIMAGFFEAMPLLIAAPSVFAASVAYKKFRPLTEPSWAQL